MKKQNEVQPLTNKSGATPVEQSQSELAQDYPLAFNNYFGQDKRPTHPLGRGITKAMAAELGIKT